MTNASNHPDLTCAAARDAWHAHCDGELPADAQAALDAHVEGCAACRAYVDDLAAIAGALAELRTSTLHIGAGHNRQVRRARAPFLNNLTRMAAAIALLAGAGVITYLAALDEPHRHGPLLPPVLRTPAPPADDEAPAVQVALIGESDDRFIPVARRSPDSSVHLFVLFQRP